MDATGCRNRHSKDVIKYTSCAYHCHRMCVQKVRIRDGVIVAVEPDDTINPGIPREDGHVPDSDIDRGMVSTRLCVMGYAQARMIYDPARVIYPMRRVGQRGEGKFERISWDEALDTVAGRLMEIKRDYGPYSIIHHPYSNSGRCSFPLAKWLGMGVAGWAAHSTNGWQEPGEWVLGTDARKLSLRQDEVNVFKSKLIVLWGINPLTTLFGAWAYNLLRAKKLGIPIISIESRYTKSVEVLADQWIPIRPTTDVAMMLAMANVWFREDLYDKDFVAKWVEPEGLKRWKDYVLGSEDQVPKTPQWAEKICGVPANTIEEFARLYVRSKPVNLNVALSLGRQIYGENSTRALMYLQALTGNTCIPGGTAAVEAWRHSPPTGSVPEVDWKRAPGTYNAPVLLTAYKWPKAVDLREKLDQRRMSEEEYNGYIGNVQGNPVPNIKMVVLEGINHINNLPDMNTTIRAMKKLDFTLVFAQYAAHPSARYADILLPQIYTAYEGRNCLAGGSPLSEDLFRGDGGLGNHWLFLQKCIDPVGEVKTRDWIWTEIARRLGLAELYNPLMAHVPEDRWDEAVEDLHREAYEKWATREENAALKPVSWEEFQEKPIFRYELKGCRYAFKNQIESGKNPFAGTGSGKIEFFSKGLAKGPKHLAANEFTPGTGKCYGPGNLPAMAQMTMGGRDTFHSQDAEKYPLLMSSPHSPYRMHSFLDNSPLLKGDCYRHAVWISVADAKARGIRDSDMVKVYNDVGEMILPAYVTSKAMPGTVCVFHGSWYVPGKTKTRLMPDGIDLGGAPNLLIHNEDVPFTVIGTFQCKGLVQVEKWGGE
jgi:anaerobic dimethyl sulfoxide reductase subunit A